MMKRRLRILLLIAVLISPVLAFAGAYEEMLSAVTMRDADKVGQLLQRGMDVNTSDRMGNTLLMLAARNGDIKTLDLLLRNRANILKKNKYMDTALMLASLQGCLQCVTALVQAGAEINPDGWTPLIYAAFEGHAGIVRFLLTLDIDVDAQSDTGFTALMAASRHNHLEIVKILLEHDADSSLTNQDNVTALDMAIKAGHSVMVTILKGQAK